MHRLKRVLDRSSDKKDHVLARASYITCENRRSDIVPMIYRTCLSSIEPAQMRVWVGVWYSLFIKNLAHYSSH